ncbi:MAG TPA: DUF6265 family protein [Saprospiraceae bacterium]|nr:DUF6265 family protein [Saprospiraceae bacterium]
MKTLVIFALVASIIGVMSCAPQTKLVNQKAVQVDWLVGKWKQLDKEVYEKWMKVTDSEFLGVSYSMESGTAEIMETMKIFRLAKEWMLEVKLPKASDPVLFKMIPDPGWPLKFENEKNDYPQIIAYRHNADSTVSALIQNLDGSKKVDFEFRKVSTK